MSELPPQLYAASDRHMTFGHEATEASAPREGKTIAATRKPGDLP